MGNATDDNNLKAIASVDEFLNGIFEISNESSTNPYGKTMLFFRGQSDKSYDLIYV